MVFLHPPPPPVPPARPSAPPPAASSKRRGTTGPPASEEPHHPHPHPPLTLPHRDVDVVVAVVAGVPHLPSAAGAKAPIDAVVVCPPTCRRSCRNCWRPARGDPRVRLLLREVADAIDSLGRIGSWVFTVTVVVHHLLGSTQILTSWTSFFTTNSSSPKGHLSS